MVWPAAVEGLPVPPVLRQLDAPVTADPLQSTPAELGGPTYVIPAIGPIPGSNVAGCPSPHAQRVIVVVTFHGNPAMDTVIEVLARGRPKRVPTFLDNR